MGRFAMLVVEGDLFSDIVSQGGTRRFWSLCFSYFH